jgi:hypothetical protein
LSEGVAEDRVGQFVGFVNFAKNLIYYLNSWIRIPVQNASYKSQPLEPGRSPPSSSALCAFEGHAPKRPHGFSIRWLFARGYWTASIERPLLCS